MARVYNFSAGPAVLPETVMQQAAAEMLDYGGTGTSVMEMSHRSKAFIDIHARAESDLRELLAIPKNYKVLFMQGGAAGQFGIIPMNILSGKTGADYVCTGQWSKKAISEAKKYCKVSEAASSEDRNFTYAPPQSKWKLDPNAAYVHYTSNETIGGVEFQWIPEVGAVPLVVDASSHILSRPLEVSRFGLIYAGAQKNIGPAGLTIVIVREDLLGHAMPITPEVFNYQVQAAADSMINTPPTYAIYIAGLVFEWLKQQGGLAAMEKINMAKSKLVYDYLDQSEFYQSPVNKDDRSRMNIPFRLKSETLDDGFLKQAGAAGLIELKGHRSVGGMRASLYNAMPMAGVQALVAFMRDFEQKQG